MVANGTFVEHWESPGDGASDRIYDFVNVIP